MWDKTGIVDFALRLTQLNFDIISTGGTARTLRESGVVVQEVNEVTGFPEILGGRVKTLHPNVHGGILARRDLASDQETLHEHGIVPIDLVVVNLYPFERRVAEGITMAEAVEEIDIGGPTMVRAAAKNHAHVGVIVNPSRYGAVLEELEQQGGQLREETRRDLAVEAFRRTAGYDAAISNWFGEQSEGEFPDVRTEQWQKMGGLRYGENPHQQAAWYARQDDGAFSMAALERHEGKEISYNNLLDASAACECAGALEGPAAAIIKHCIPCGAAEAEDLATAFEHALAGDPLSAFGGILALNQPLTESLAKRIAVKELFFEVIHAPAIEPGALEAIRNGARWGKNCRVLVGGQGSGRVPRPLELRSIPGAILLQQRDAQLAARDDFRVATKAQPTDDQWRDLMFAWRVVPFVRSNAILLASNRAVVGVGSGQPSRVDAVEIACRKAGEKSRGSVLASDAFFPFPDGVEAAAEAGVTAVIQPGGSIRDDAIVEAADKAGMTMVLTGERHFRH